MERKISELRSLIYGRFDSQTEFAKHLNWSKQRLSKVTSGKKEPSISEISEIATGLGMEISAVVPVFVEYWTSEKRKAKA
jgi:transcriptional regulator with XRE-family HTH domain